MNKYATREARRYNNRCHGSHVFARWLIDMGACTEAIRYALKWSTMDAGSAWAMCRNPNWMLWLIDRRFGRETHDSVFAMLESVFGRNVLYYAEYEQEHEMCLFLATVIPWREVIPKEVSGVPE